MGQARLLLSMTAAAILSACGAQLEVVGQPDAGDAGRPLPDAGDGGRDAGPDAGRDAGPNMSPDAGDAGADEPDGGDAGVFEGALPFSLDGGALPSLDFGVVGDTRPPIYDLTDLYPTQTIQTIYADMEALSPAIGFAISTGDYMFASPFLGQAAPQAQLYVTAALIFDGGQTYPSMGNHECDYSTTSANCSGQTTNPNFNAYLDTLLGGLGLPSVPYFAVFFNSSDPSRPWTAKFLLTAPNAWDDGQNSWLADALSIPTTYTFIVRHEPVINAQGAPGVAPSEILAAEYPLTLKLTGHSHSYTYDPTNMEVVNGLGGAALDTGYTGTYGYAVCRQRMDDAIQCSLFDYDTNQVSNEPNSVFAINADGSAAVVQ